MVAHLNKHKLLSECQSGYKKTHSCSTAVLKITDDIRQAFDIDFLTILVLLDFSKAFDKVFHPLLLHKLKFYFGFSSSAIALLKSYLSMRSQRVCSKGATSSAKLISSGVPQGSILGPTLFSMFINDIVHCVKNSSIHLYADDAQIYMSRPIGLSEDLISRINDDLSAIYCWSKNNLLDLNVGKTKAIAISRVPYDLATLPNIFLNDVPVRFEKVVTSLGFKINSMLTCSDHINFTVSKMYFVLRKLWQTARLVPQITKMKLVRSLALPALAYCEVVYGNMDSASRNKVQLCLNNLARFVFSKRKYDSISEESKQLFNCNLEGHLKKPNLLFMHRLIHSQRPSYLFSKVSLSQSHRTHNLIPPVSKCLATSHSNPLEHLT